MHRQNVFAVGLLLFAFVLVVAVGYAKGYGPLGLLDSGIRRLTGGGGTRTMSTSLEADRQRGFLNLRRAHGSIQNRLLSKVLAVASCSWSSGLSVATTAATRCHS